MSTTANATTYFGYGSNLWKQQMTKRCPTSSYLGIARLSGFKWIINSRGYANVVEMKNGSTAVVGNKTDEVWGLVYSLQPEDERRLDLNEGVPIAYTKETLPVSYWPSHNGSTPNVTDTPLEMGMLVYIDRTKTEPDRPKKEYIYRMNMGIKDALAEGVPEGYVDGVMRNLIPAGKEGEVDEGTRGWAEKQAVMFVEEED